MDITEKLFIEEVRIHAPLLAHMDSLYGNLGSRSRATPLDSLAAEAQSLTSDRDQRHDRLPDFAVSRVNSPYADKPVKEPATDGLRLTFQATGDELLLTFNSKNDPEIVTGVLNIRFSKINSALRSYRDALGDAIYAGAGHNFGALEKYRRYSHIEAMRSLFPGPVNREEASFTGTERRIATIIAKIFPKGPFKEQLEQDMSRAAPTHPLFKYQDGYAVFDKTCTPK